MKFYVSALVGVIIKVINWKVYILFISAKRIPYIQQNNDRITTSVKIY